MPIHSSAIWPLISLLAAAPAFAGIGPESTAIVVNGDSWASLAVANEYSNLRHIPAGNVIVLSGLSAFDAMDVNQFRAEVLGPALKALDDRGLRSQIDCIAYSVDLPSAVYVNADMAGKPFPQIITPVASANSLTYLSEWVMKKDADYLRLDINRYSRRTLPLIEGSPLTPAERAEYQRGMKLYDGKQYAEAAAAISALTAVKRNDGGIYYNLACCLALAGKADQAMTALTDANAAGWRNFGQNTSDPDLESLRNRPDFKALIDRMKAQRVQVQPARGFRSTYSWSTTGEPGAAGPKYLLSTMLGVTSGRGNSVNEVLACLKRAEAADGTSPRGTVYIERNGDVRSSTREWAFTDVADQLRHMNVACTVEDGVLPKAKKDVAGAVVGIADFDWNASGSTILPGAICEHLTSCGGMMGERDGQTPCTEFIRAGAAGSSGAVTEPFALQEKFPSPFMQLHYAQGSTLAEAFYQSLDGPYQLLIIGDPLCRPWGKHARVTLPGIAPHAKLQGKVELKPTAADAAGFAAFIDGTLVASGAAPLTIDTATLADGEHDLSIVATLKDSLETRVRHEVPVNITNSGRAVAVTSKPPARVTYGDKLKVEMSSEGATGLDVMHFGRSVGHCDGAKGTVEIETSQLGTGHIELTPVARFAASQSATGPAIKLEVAVSASKMGKPAATKPPEKGLLLKITGAGTSVVKDTFDSDWIAKAGVKEGQAFELTGVFDAAKTDLFQVQLKSNGPCVVEVDGAKVATGDKWQWRFAPVQLGPGVHRIKLSGTAAKDPRVDFRFGAAGTAHPSEARFTHEKPK